MSRRALTPLIVTAFLVLSTTSVSAQRPAPGDPYEAGIELFSYPSDGGNFRVWYVTESADAVQPGDVDPQDGIPDFVAEVATVAEETYAAMGQMGFRLPLVDADQLPANQVGGDDRFDIYLLNFASADGSYEIDGCLSMPDVCIGYVIMENDFLFANYPSDEIAIRVLVSHEYFHAVQAAYDFGQDNKWTEGTAVWIEEKLYPEQDDYERLLAGFFEKPHRAFERTSGAPFGDFYIYGAAIWPTFLDERFGPDIVREIWEGSEDLDGSDPEFLDITDQLLQTRYGSSLRDAWIEFTQWNLFTGERADPSRAYEHGADWDEIALEPTITAAADGTFEASQQTEGMSARYTPIELPDIGGETRYLAIEVPTGSPAVGTVYFWRDGSLGEAISLEPDESNPARAGVELAWQGTESMYLVVTGVSRGSPMRTVNVTLTVPEVEEPPDTGGCSIGGQSDSGACGSLFALVLAALWLRRRGSREGGRRSSPSR